MDFFLHPSELFYYRNSVVKVSKKPKGVIRYMIYAEIDPPKVIVPWNRYDMKEGGMLEVVTEDLERYFFCYQSGMFVEKIFKKIEILEGEQELAKQLDLFVGQEYLSNYGEEWNFKTKPIKKHE